MTVALMKVAVCERYRDLSAFRIVERPIPTVGPGEVLVRVLASSVTTGDWRVQSLELGLGFKFICRLLFGWSKPKFGAFGTEASGIIHATGADVKEFKIGDRVVFSTGARFGCHAEFVKVSAGGAVARVPEALELEDMAALTFGAAAAFEFLVGGTRLAKGEKVLVLGASGSVGAAAVQIAKNIGAEVTAVCRSENFDFVRGLGATHVLDYRTTDFSKHAREFDVVLDVVGQMSSRKLRSLVRAGGRLALVSANLPQILMAQFSHVFTGIRTFAFPVMDSQQILLRLVDMVASQKLVVPVDSRFTLEEIAKAFGRVSQRHRRGNVLIRVAT